MNFFILTVLLLLNACASREEQEEKLTAVAESQKSGLVEMHSSTEKNFQGKIVIEEVPDALILTADLSGLKKSSQLGIHIHEKGICEGPGYKSAGEHYNPHKSKHGMPNSTEAHSGDMGNLLTDQNGKSETKMTLKGVRLNEVMGKAIIIHAKIDDFKTQPSGNSGERIACGLIRSL